MRDLLLIAVIYGTLPFVFSRPYLGIYLWSWVGYMSPHRLTWGLAYSQPFAQVIAIVTLAAALITKKRQPIPWTSVTITIVLLTLWMGMTTIFALVPDDPVQQYIKILKIQFMVFMTLILITDREQLINLIWVITLSFGFYGVKGGVYTVLHGGANRVLGPEGSFIAGNTEIGLVMVMTLPLMYFLTRVQPNPWIRRGLFGAMGLTAIAILGTYSRGALLGLLAMSLFLIMKSRQKVPLLIMIAIGLPLIVGIMPRQWTERMHTIESYEEDTSAMGRISAWMFSIDMANSRLFGGGFFCETPENYARYSPDTPVVLGKAQAAHSIYFQMLGQHGYIGLVLFLFLLISTWRTARSIVRETKGRPTVAWAYDLASMIQVSFVGYIVSGAFLSLAYFDLSYHLMAILLLVGVISRREQAEGRVESTAVPIGGSAQLSSPPTRP